jgi:diacylglycerol kinase
MANDFWKTVFSTAKIDPGEYAAQISRSRLSSFSYALAGWLYMLRRQKNTRIMSVVSFIIFGLAIWLRLSAVEMAVLVLTITIVWLTEFLNAGIEAAVDLASPEIHPMAKVGKDVASAAVLLGVVASMVIGLLLMGPPLIERLGLFAG